MEEDQRYQPDSAGLNSYSPAQQEQILRMIGAERNARPNQMDAVRALVNANPQMADNIAQKIGISPESMYSGDPNNPGQLFGWLGRGPEGNGDTPIVPKKSSEEQSGKVPQKPKGHKNVVDQVNDQKRKKVIDDTRAFLAKSSQGEVDPSGIDWATAALMGGGAAAAGGAGYAAYRMMRNRGGAAAEAPVMGPNGEIVSSNRVTPVGGPEASMDPRNALARNVDAVMGDDIIDAEFTPVDNRQLAAAAAQKALPAPQQQLPPPAQAETQRTPPVATVDQNVNRIMDEDGTDTKPAKKKRVVQRGRRTKDGVAEVAARRAGKKAATAAKR